MVAHFAPGEALGRIREGQRARIRLDPLPWTEYGAVPAVVTRVAGEPRNDVIRVEMQIREAETVYRELGLGDLLDRMPSGMMQVVGETGWQLSHGERSRLFIARALLQGSPVVLLDESLAALDPETLRTSVAAIIERAPALVLIAHP